MYSGVGRGIKTVYDLKLQSPYPTSSPGGNPYTYYYNHPNQNPNNPNSNGNGIISPRFVKPPYMSPAGPSGAQAAARNMGAKQKSVKGFGQGGKEPMRNVNEFDGSMYFNLIWGPEMDHN